MSSTPKLFALFIDGDNISPDLVPQILKEIEEHNGNPIIKNVYLNSSPSSSNSWSEVIREHALHQISVPQNTPYKNAVDIALVIDAMELLCENSNDRDTDIQGFCIVASDSDYTRLALRLVAKKKYVLGIVDGRAPSSFMNACTEFVRIDDSSQLNGAIDLDDISQVDNTSQDETLELIFDALFVVAYENVRQSNEGWVSLLEVKDAMKAMDDGFSLSEYRNTKRFREKIEELAKSYPLNIVKINPRLDGEKTVHDIWVDSDIFKLVDAYNRATAQGNKGFVLFSVMGTELREYKKYDSEFSYCDIKKLTDAILKIEEDYPWLIKTDKKETDGKPPVYSVRVKK